MLGRNHKECKRSQASRKTRKKKIVDTSVRRKYNASLDWKKIRVPKEGLVVIQDRSPTEAAMQPFLI